MAFHFSLKGVLRLRESLEQAELQQLRVTAALVAQTRSEIDSLDQAMDAARRQYLDATAAPGLTGAELHFEISRESAVGHLRAQLLERLAGLEKIRNEQQRRYLQARMQREIFSNLQKRQLAVYKVEQSRREQQQIDELFLIHSHADTE